MKKLVSLTLALLLCVGMLAGCSGSNNNGSDAAGDGIIKLAVSSDILGICRRKRHTDRIQIKRRR